jgi:hypothetical protein
MKKVLVGSVIALAAFTASALELGVNVSRDFSSTPLNSVGLTLGKTLGSVNVGVGYSRSTNTQENQNRFSLGGGVNLMKVGSVLVTPNASVVYLNNSQSANGYAMTAGVDFSMPITKKLDGYVDVSHQFGQDRVSRFDGTALTAGVRYKF